jgi:hypothetical protein
MPENTPLERKLKKLRELGIPVDAFNDKLMAQVDLLDDNEIAALGAIKAKLNSGLDQSARQAAGNVGGFIW